MMHTLSINLKNNDLLRLTVEYNTLSERSTPLEHKLCRQAEANVNADPQHSKYGPWKVVSSKWIL